MLLQDRNAVIYGAGGDIGRATARAFAREGAKVFLAGRTLRTLERTAEQVASVGGDAETAVVDALDPSAVEDHVADVAERAGRVDISFDAIGMDDVQGTPLVDMAVDDFTRPIVNAARTQFVTAKAVAPHMVDRGSGVIMMLTASPARIGWPRVGGFGPACAALEGLSRQLAAELGPSGVRVVCLRSAGSPESIPDTMEAHAAGRQTGRDEFIEYLEGTTQLRRLPSLDDVGNVAALMASDAARTMTGTVANITCGQILD